MKSKLLNTMNIGLGIASGLAMSRFAKTALNAVGSNGPVSKIGNLLIEFGVGASAGTSVYGILDVIGTFIEDEISTVKNRGDRLRFCAGPFEEAVGIRSSLLELAKICSDNKVYVSDLFDIIGKTQFDGFDPNAYWTCDTILSDFKIVPSNFEDNAYDVSLPMPTQDINFKKGKVKDGE